MVRYSRLCDLCCLGQGLLLLDPFSLVYLMHVSCLVKENGHIIFTLNFNKYFNELDKVNKKNFTSPNMLLSNQ